jgi:hypothetical protein
VEEKCLEEMGCGWLDPGVLVLEGELDLFEDEWSRESGMNRDCE